MIYTISPARRGAESCEGLAGEKIVNSPHSFTAEASSKTALV